MAPEFTCPHCKGRINAKIIRPNKRIDLLCKCGYVWQAYSGKYKIEEVNEFYGCWKDQEVITLLKAMDTSHYCDDDRRFYKGKSLYTTWRESNVDTVRCFSKFANLVRKV